MIHAYVLQEFKDHPSFARFVSEGYCLSSNKSESLLDEGNWQAIVTPGSIVVMSILTPSFNMDWAWDHCPEVFWQMGKFRDNQMGRMVSHQCSGSPEKES